MVIFCQEIILQIEQAKCALQLAEVVPGSSSIQNWSSKGNIVVRQAAGKNSEEEKRRWETLTEEACECI